MACLECPYCSKSYVSRSAFRRHILLCGDDPGGDETVDGPPPPSQVYKMLLELARQHQELCSRFDALKKQIPAKTRRIGLVDWLRRTQGECQTYEKWKDNLQISRADLELVFRIGHKKGVTQILEACLPAGGLGDNAPIRSFTQYPSILFIKTDADGWRAATIEDTQGLVSHVTRLLSRELSAWQEENRDQMGSERFMADFPKKVRYATGADHPLQVSASYLKSRLCVYLRCQACTLIECEVTGDASSPGGGKRRLHRDAANTGV